MIEIKNLVKQFQNETEIEYRDMIFENGKSYMLLGASGCGKSTLLNIIAGILSATSGQVLIDGTDMSLASQKEKDTALTMVSTSSLAQREEMMPNCFCTPLSTVFLSSPLRSSNRNRSGKQGRFSMVQPVAPRGAGE